MQTIEPWRDVWRRGFAPQLSTRHLQAVQRALLADDARLLQGATTSPAPLSTVPDWPAEGACLTGYGFAFVGEEKSVRDVGKFFAAVCAAADQEIGEPAACRFFLNWYDETPRHEMRLEMLAEIKLALSQRK